MTRLSGSALIQYLNGIDIVRLDPVGRMSASGVGLDERGLDELVQKGDPILPTNGIVPEDPLTVAGLFNDHKGDVCFALTPDGHLHSHKPLRFDADRAVEQVIAILAEDMADEDREEALAATWLCLGFHNSDHSVDLGGLLLDVSVRERGCHVDVKLTQAHAPDRQRTKLEQRACERKLGVMAQTVTMTCNGGFRGYPGFGQPGLVVTLLFNPVQAGRSQSGYTVNWFFHLASNYQASAARWGWGGALGVKLPESLCAMLRGKSVKLGKERIDYIGLLAEFGNYAQFRNDKGQWDTKRLKATLTAMALAARYLLMHENTLEHAQTSLANLQPKGVRTPLILEEFQPGDSLTAHFGRLCDSARDERDSARDERDSAIRNLDQTRDERDSARDERDSAIRNLDQTRNERDSATHRIRQSVERRRQRGHTDEEIAEDLGFDLADFLQQFPRS